VSSALHATTVSRWLSDLLVGVADGVVLARFDRSAYLDLDGRVAALASAEFGCGPLTIAVAGFEMLRPLDVGDPVRLRDGTLRVGAQTIGLRSAAVWDPALPPAGDGRGGKALGLDLVVDELRRSAGAEGIADLLSEAGAAVTPTAPLLDPLRRGLGAISHLLRGRIGADAAARTVATEIAGRGPGLTPSGDDLLAGIMHAITAWPELAAGAAGPDVRRLFADAARPKTTRISAAYLDAAARGHAGEPWHALVRSLGQSRAEARRAARRVLAIGETSGADALTGFCWAWRRLPA
jgi:hypothetical protein